MQRFYIYLALLLNFLFLPFSKIFSQNSEVFIQEMIGFPDFEAGYSAGVSAAFAGMLEDKLLLAGGCNFPEIPVIEGGKKRFYKGIYLAELNSSQSLTWHMVGELPQTAAYGVTVAYEGKLVLVGGQNDTQALQKTYVLSLKESKQIRIDTFPSLPVPIDNMGGAVLNGILYIVGGKSNGKASETLYALSLINPASGWQNLGKLPGEIRIQPVVVASESDLFIWGGFSPANENTAPAMSNAGFRFQPESGKWDKLSAPMDKCKREVSLAGGVGMVLSHNEILCMGGVNAKIFFKALKREQKYSAEKAQRKSIRYLSHPVSWYKFNQQAFIYNIQTNSWKLFVENPLLARAGASIVSFNNQIFYIAGETKPGIRSPKITRITTDTQK